jgi:hypothetical protein
MTEDSAIELPDSTPEYDDTMDAGAPVDSLDALCERYLPTLAARIWAACCWPDHMEDGWKIGDYRFVIFSTSPEPETTLYVQFWSEPLEPAVMEVCSGEWSPGSVKYVQKAQRLMLESLGFRKGGEARNYSRTLPITNVDEAEEAARQALHILYELGFRGQWPLEIQLERDERAEEAPVYEAITPDDLLKLLLEHDYAGALVDADGTQVLLARHGRRNFTAGFDWRVDKQHLYGAVLLDAMVAADESVTDGALLDLGGALPGVAVRRHDAATLRLSLPLMMTGGVTADWIVESVAYFLQAVRRCEKLLRERSRPRRGRARPSSKRDVNVH